MSATPGPTPQRFFDIATAYQKSAAMKAAIELGLFTAIAEGHNTADAIARRCRVAQRGARILADYLTVLGFLKKADGIYTLAEDTLLFLDRNSPAYVGGSIEFLASTHLHDQFNALTDRVRAGGAPLTGSNSLAPEHDMWVNFARGMAGLMTMPAQMIAQHLLALPALAGARPLKILDIAAGHGIFGLAFLQQSPHARVIGLDWKNVLTVALDHARKMGVTDRYTTIAGSAFDVDFGSGYDLVLLPNFLHHFDAPTNLVLLKKVHQALKPGGLVATLEFSPDEDRITPPNAAEFALVMLTTTPAGDAYTVSEMQQLHRDAGFTSVNMLPIGMQRLFVGSTPRRASKRPHVIGG